MTPDLPEPALTCTMEHRVHVRNDVILGRQPVVEALRGGRPVNRILLARDVGRHSTIAEILHLSRERRVPVEYVPREAVRHAAGSGAHQGVVAYAAAREYVTLQELADAAGRAPDPPLYVVLDGIEDPQNLGAILRSAEATGVHGAVVRTRRAAGLTSAVSRASAGALEYVPVARVSNIATALEFLKSQGTGVVGIDASGDTRYTDVDMGIATAIVVGSEGKGISALVRRKCDVLASIPMRGRVGSLNASVAAALVMYEAFRQRGW